ncbi:MAG: hypothetical protein M1833_001253 [Piccolia ochrophora]|nr:MAG: hypothetical protein M1833_001253 [Piccolia ochrophora]
MGREFGPSSDPVAVQATLRKNFLNQLQHLQSDAPASKETLSGQNNWTGKYGVKLPDPSGYSWLIMTMPLHAAAAAFAPIVSTKPEFSVDPGQVVVSLPWMSGYASDQTSSSEDDVESVGSDLSSSKSVSSTASGHYRAASHHSSSFEIVYDEEHRSSQEVVDDTRKATDAKEAHAKSSKEAKSKSAAKKRGKTWKPLSLTNDAPTSTNWGSASMDLVAGKSGASSKNGTGSSGSSSSTRSSSPQAPNGRSWANVANSVCTPKNLSKGEYPALGVQAPSNHASSAAFQVTTPGPKNTRSHVFSQTFPPLGATPSTPKGASVPAWKPVDTFGDEARERQRLEAQKKVDEMDWNVHTRVSELKAAEFAATREARRAEAMEIKEQLKKEGITQRPFPCPKEITAQLLLSLDHKTRQNVAMTCRDAFDCVNEVMATWNLTKGEFQGADTGGKRILPQNCVQPATKHSVTVVTHNATGEEYMGEQLSMMKKTTIGLYNMSDHFRRLEFHKLPLLSSTIIAMVAPHLPNLEFLGVYNCPLLPVTHTPKLLNSICIGRQKMNVQLDFFPTLVYRYPTEVDWSTGLPALLYQILPQAYKQGARLMEKGLSFERFIRASGSKVEDWVFEKIEQEIQDRDVVERMSMCRNKTTFKRISPTSNEARFYHCEGCQLTLRGCFFAKRQLGDDDPNCWGCRLHSELKVKRVNGYHDRDVSLNSWLDSAASFSHAVELAKGAQPLGRTGDKTYGQFYREKEDQKQLARLVEKGRIKPGQTKLPGRLNWAKVRNEPWSSAIKRL